MSTPIFESSPRDVVTPVLTLLRGYLWFFGFTALAFVGAYLWVPSFKAVDRFPLIKEARDLVPWAIGGALAFLIALSLLWMRRRISGWIGTRQKRRIAEIRLPDQIHAPVLCIWARGDEVMTGFRVADRLADFSLLLLRLRSIATVATLVFVLLLPAKNNAIFLIDQLLGIWIFRILVVSLYPIALLVEYVGKISHIGVAETIPIATVLVTMRTVTIGSLASFFAAAAVHIVLKLLPFGMMSWHFVDSFFLQIAPAKGPIGGNTTVMEKELPRNGLMHSSVYASPSAFVRIVEFIRKHAEKEGVSPIDPGC